MTCLRGSKRTSKCKNIIKDNINHNNININKNYNKSDGIASNGNVFSALFVQHLHKNHKVQRWGLSLGEFTQVYTRGTQIHFR